MKTDLFREGFPQHSSFSEKRQQEASAFSSRAAPSSMHNGLDEARTASVARYGKNNCGASAVQEAFSCADEQVVARSARLLRSSLCSSSVRAARDSDERSDLFLRLFVLVWPAELVSAPSQLLNRLSFPKKSVFPPHSADVLSSFLCDIDLADHQLLTPGY